MKKINLPIYLLIFSISIKSFAGGGPHDPRPGIGPKVCAQDPLKDSISCVAATPEYGNLNIQVSAYEIPRSENCNGFYYQYTMKGILDDGTKVLKSVVSMEYNSLENVHLFSNSNGPFSSKKDITFINQGQNSFLSIRSSEYDRIRNNKDETRETQLDCHSIKM